MTNRRIPPKAVDPLVHFIFDIVEERGISNYELANMTGYGRNRFNDMFTGRSSPRLVMVRDTLQILGYELPNPVKTNE